MARIAELTRDNQSPLAEFMVFANNVGLAIEAAQRSPELQRAVYVVNALSLELSRSPLVQFLAHLQRADLRLVLAPTMQAEAAHDADAWYRECVEFAWTRRYCS